MSAAYHTATEGAVTVLLERRGGQVIHQAMAAEREPLETWLESFFRDYHPVGYGSYSNGILETEQGFVVTCYRFAECH